MPETNEIKALVFSYGVIVRGTVKAIEELKEYIERHPDLTIAFNMVSSEKLKIVKNGGEP